VPVWPAYRKAGSDINQSVHGERHLVQVHTTDYHDRHIRRASPWRTKWTPADGRRNAYFNWTSIVVGQNCARSWPTVVTSFVDRQQQFRCGVVSLATVVTRGWLGWMSWRVVRVAVAGARAGWSREHSAVSAFSRARTHASVTMANIMTIDVKRWAAAETGDCDAHLFLFCYWMFCLLAEVRRILFVNFC